ncbi:glycosyltransferase [Vibrio europaeus]|uniref:glycosyltransferase n=2 Tax=Vibrio europaeus TaxID=300876 RepID=UPI00148C1D83|nr:glycosyltransferase [Vibrio europaeus]MDC5822038.1 glycosyltransferase [Vibrio europaeus]MDC5837981.1 glycosyltransferase [Vibrio europaeus]MDC5855123.1 glycosyltransferase [Vibrio europaeus]
MKNQPGAGQHAFFYSDRIKEKTKIFVSRNGSEDKYDFGNDVEVIRMATPDAVLGDTSGFLSRLRILSVKLFGDLVCGYVSIKELWSIRQDVRLIHVHSIGFMFTGLLLKLVCRSPVVFGFHGTDFLRVEKSTLARKVFSRYDGFICVSPLMVQPLQEMFCDKPIKYVGNFVDTDFFTLPDSHSEKGDYLLCVASLRWQKDIHTLIKSYAYAASENPSIQVLKIVGSGPQEQELKNLVGQLGLENRVVFEGAKSRAEVLELMTNCHFFILSSVKEGFPKVVLEALACGKFVISTNAGALSEILNEDVSLIVGVGDCERLGMEIARFSSLTFDRTLALKCRAVAEQYSIDSLVKNVSSLYGKVYK